MARLPPMEEAKIKKDWLAVENMMKAAPQLRGPNGVTEEGVVGLPQNEKGLSSSSGDLKPQVRNQNTNTKGRKRRRTGWLTSCWLLDRHRAGAHKVRPATAMAAPRARLA